MTDPLIRTPGIVAARLAECDAAVKQLAERDAADSKVIKKLRGELGGELADLVLTVAALQKKARKKLDPDPSLSRVWWVTQRSLQQATAWQVARLKASWFDDRLVYDLCCGIGGDAISMAERGPLVAVDSDPRIADMAAANLARTLCVAPQGLVRCADVTQMEIPRRAAIHMDPDRRVHHGRKSNPEHYAPSWSQVLAIIANTESAVIKLAPAAKVQSRETRDAHRCWISLSGTVREQSLLCGQSMERAGLTPNTKSAVCLDASGFAAWFVPGANESDAFTAGVAMKPGVVLIDPDASIRAAGLTQTYAARFGFHLLAGPSGYLTCDDMGPAGPSVARTATVGNVIWSGPCDDRKLRREFRRRGVYPATIKVRGTDHDPAILTKHFRRCGDVPITLWIGRTSSGVFAAITGDGTVCQ